MAGRRLAVALVATALVFGGLGAGLTLLVTGDDRETAAAPERTVAGEQGPAAQIAVPDLTGLKLSAAVERAQAAGFTTTIVARGTTRALRGTIIDQMPAAGTTQPRGSALTLVMARSR